MQCAGHLELRRYQYELDLAFNNVKPKDWYFALDKVRFRTELGWVVWVTRVILVSAQVLLVLTLGLWTSDLGLTTLCKLSIMLIIERVTDILKVMEQVTDSIDLLNFMFCQVLVLSSSAYCQNSG